jgi:hypothetical protein
MGDIYDSYFEWRDEQDKKKDLEIEEKKKYLDTLSFEEKVEIMFSQFKQDEIGSIWKRYSR